MCGIGCILSAEGPVAEPVDEWTQRLRSQLQPRGPDHWGSMHVQCADVRATLLSSVLHMRGRKMRSQPVYDEACVAVFNGEVFDGLEVGPLQSDTDVIMTHLCAATQECTDPDDVASRVRGVLCRVEGPYAVIFVHRPSRCLLYARDPIGRRSLLVRQAGDAGQGGEFVIASVSAPLPLTSTPAPEAPWQEVPPYGVWTVRLDAASITIPPVLASWVAGVVSLRHCEMAEVGVNADCSTEAAAGMLLMALDDAVRRRIQGTGPPDAQLTLSAKVAVLFSGGIDCMVLAAVLHRQLAEDEAIDLINVCFDQAHESPDRLAAIQGVRALQDRYPDRVFNLTLVDVEADDVLSVQPHIKRLIHPCSTPMDCNIGVALWYAARGAGRLWESSYALEDKNGWLRYAGMNDTHGDLSSEPSVHAAGSETASVVPKEYKSTARVLLVGTGCDEQLGGYFRYRSAFQKNGQEGLEAEVAMDQERLWQRNLGRDDRCISDSGKEARFPYLDEGVIRLLQSLPATVKFNLQDPPGIGDKKLLRFLAAELLGLSSCSRLVKRAIQFGSRIAKLANTVNFGSHAAGKGERWRKGDWKQLDDER